MSRWKSNREPIADEPSARRSAFLQQQVTWQTQVSSRPSRIQAPTTTTMKPPRRPCRPTTMPSRTKKSPAIKTTTPAMAVIAVIRAISNPQPRRPSQHISTRYMAAKKLRLWSRITIINRHRIDCIASYSSAMCAI